ncbi:DUF6527 family protein [Flavobacterium sp.]|uniref:DUF6527 family protein n=1 Tax=Flavobacterium sp. TaxID=239 RepID=UPI0037BEDC8F
MSVPVVLSGPRKETGGWSWNGDMYKPTLKPSFRTVGDDETGNEYVCHTWVTDGEAIYLSDTTHELKGTRVPLLPVD